jgi:hypothetical protein
MWPQDNSNALTRKRFEVNLNPEGSRIVSWKRLLKGSAQGQIVPGVRSADRYDSDDSELSEKEWNQYRMQYRVDDSDGDSTDSDAYESLKKSAGAPNVVENAIMELDQDGVAENPEEEVRQYSNISCRLRASQYTMQNSLDKSDGDSSHWNVSESEESAGDSSRLNVWESIKESAGARNVIEKAIKELTDAIAENPVPVVRDYSMSGGDGRQKVRQYLPPNVKEMLKGVTMLYLQENEKFSKEFINRLKSLLGGMMKPRTLEAYLRRRQEEFHGNGSGKQSSGV